LPAQPLLPRGNRIEGDTQAPSPRPLVTFALFAYNQERFIAEAVEAALAQDYSPLQVILSDDCSTDRTFSIMREIADSYRGPHIVLTQRNATNLGVGAHINKVAELAKGSLIVEAAGDDVSAPNRVTRTVRAWEDSGRRATSIYSSMELINEHGTLLRLDRGYRTRAHPTLLGLARLEGGPRGAAHTFCPKLLSKFGPLNEDVVNEDAALVFRSALAGSFAYIHDPLVKYRIHSGSLSSKDHQIVARTPSEMRSAANVNAKRALALLRQHTDDARRLFDENHEVLRILRAAHAEVEFSIRVLEKKSAEPLFRVALDAVNQGATLTAIVKLVIKAWTWPVYARYSDVRRRMIVRRNTKTAKQCVCKEDSTSE
jgi:glycosyltransferase involved in cell wall biosynthesis